MLALVPITSACTIGWSNRPDRILACSISDLPQTTANTASFAGLSSPPNVQQSPQLLIASPKAVALAKEPGIAIPATTAEAPVTFPGYVLSDDSREDLLHEGS
jgi:hypothetical protein